MVYVNGIVYICYVQSGQVYEIDVDMFDFESVFSEECSMGLEIVYLVVVEYLEFGQFIWLIWEYLIGVKNYCEIDVGLYELLNNFEFGLEYELLDLDEDGDERIDEED